jgi:hypothetical protein
MAEEWERGENGRWGDSVRLPLASAATPTYHQSRVTPKAQGHNDDNGQLHILTRMNHKQETSITIESPPRPLS